MLLYLSANTAVTGYCAFEAWMRQLMQTVTPKQEKAGEILEIGKRESEIGGRRFRELG